MPLAFKCISKGLIMRIGIDIDGCLNDVRHTLINEGIKW